MNLDEQISKRVDKGYRFELWNENVKILTQIKIQKGQFLLPFFYVCTKNLQRTLQRMFKEPIFAELLFLSRHFTINGIKYRLSIRRPRYRTPLLIMGRIITFIFLGLLGIILLILGAVCVVDLIFYSLLKINETPFLPLYNPVKIVIMITCFSIVFKIKPPWIR